MTTRTWAIPVLMLLAACSGGGGGDGGGPSDGPGDVTAPTTVASYCETFWSAFAERWAACEHGSAAYYEGWFDATRRCADPIQAVAAGRASYDRTRAGACLAYVAGASCENLEALADDRLAQADCAGAVAGKEQEFATCHSNASCASDLCIGSPGTCPSVCVTPLGRGAECGSGVPCGPGSYCRMLDLSFTCQPLEPQGQPCREDLECAPGLFCAAGADLRSSCQPRRTSGACAADEECAIGHRCAGGACAPRPGAGDPCTQGENECGLGLWCGDGGTCVEAPGPGEPCSIVNGEWRDCVGGECVAGFCAAWTEGATCAIHAQCAPTMTCDDGACTTLCAEP